jgi:pilus assembly protein CpaF
MNTGHDGSMTTVHANSPRDVLTRLEVMVTMGNSNLGLKSIRQQVSAALDVIIQTSRLSDGTRKIMSITEVGGMEGDTVTLQDLFVFEKRGLSAEGKVLGRFAATGIRPRFHERMLAHGITLPAELFESVVEVI